MATTDRLQGFDIGVAVKPACYVASTGNLTLSSTQVVDGIAVGSCERVLVKDQTDDTENGIYMADSSTWTRAKDFDGSRDAIPGTLVYVDRGSQNLSSFWVANSSSTATKIDIDTDSITFSQVTLSLSGVSAFSQALLNESSASDWRSSTALDVQQDVITTQGDLVIGSTAATSIAERLAVGSSVQMLGVADGVPAWGTLPIFESSTQTVLLDTSLTLAHSLGAEPSGISLILENHTADLNYSTGDRVFWPADQTNVTIWADSTNVYVVHSTALSVTLQNKTTRANQAISSTKWAWIVKAWV